MDTSGSGRACRHGGATAGFSLIELMIAVGIIGILASIAVPSFLAMRARARQSEAKVNLKAIFSVLRVNLAERSTYVCGFCGWVPEGKPRYTYSVSATEILVGVDGCSEGVPPASQTDPDGATGLQGGFVATAGGNIDTDATCDAWSINDAHDLRMHVSDADE